MEDLDTKLAQIKSEIKNEMMTYIKSELNMMTLKINKKIDETCEVMKRENKQSNEIVPVDEAKLEQSIMKKIDKKYNNKINQMVELTSYHMQDTDELVNQYRRQVVSDDRKSDTKLLTANKDNRHILSEHVSLVFEHS